MSDSMSISVNGQSQVPPGFRFHPTEEELLHYYLKKKVLCEKIDLDVIRDVDLNKLEPWDIQEICNIGSTPQNDWYFFSHKDKKYPTGTRTNRATTAGFWKATGRDKVIHGSGMRIGMRKTLVFYKGRAPHGQKSDWIMHEYRLDDVAIDHTNVSEVMGEGAQEEGWVICRIFKKKNHYKTLDNNNIINSPFNNHEMMLSTSCNEGGGFDQILGSSYNNQQYNDSRFLKLPNLDSPNSPSSPNLDPNSSSSSVLDSAGNLANWVDLDRLVASQLNAQTENSSQLACFNDPTANMAYSTNSNDEFHDLPNQKSSPFSLPSNRTHQAILLQDYNTEIELWNFTPR